MPNFKANFKQKSSAKSSKIHKHQRHILSSPGMQQDEETWIDHFILNKISMLSLLTNPQPEKMQAGKKPTRLGNLTQIIWEFKQTPQSQNWKILEEKGICCLAVLSDLLDYQRCF